MSSVQKAVFPGFIAGVIFLLFSTNYMAVRNPVLLVVKPAPMGMLTASVSQPLAAKPPMNAVETTVQEIKPEPAENQEDGCGVSSAFPESVLRWCALIDQYAGVAGVDSNLVAAVMLQESGGNPDAYSKSGAVGLMQVMPRDGIATKFHCVNGPCFAARPSSQELYDPEFNISYGTRMLAGLIQKTGSERDALRAYGPMDMGYRYADIVLGIYERYGQ